MITTRVFEFHIVKDLRERTLYIGGSMHTIFFKYEICKIDENGTVVNSVSFHINFTLLNQHYEFTLLRKEMKKIRCKWLPIEDKESDQLPLSELPSARKK